MKAKLTDDIKDIFQQGFNWAKLEIEYVKLTTAEKLVVLLSTIIIGAIMAVLLLPVFIMFLFALVGVFRLFMAPPLAYLTVGGVVLLIIFAIFLMRKPLIIIPVARFITKLFLDKNTRNPSKDPEKL
ncbi:MAG: phage holin family protein, partial [Muribaculaceae bacterium]|nr:phage holin family protein [Muribaculaceae bacterium]